MDTAHTAAACNVDHDAGDGVTRGMICGAAERRDFPAAAVSHAARYHGTIIPGGTVSYAAKPPVRIGNFDVEQCPTPHCIRCGTISRADRPDSTVRLIFDVRM